VTDFFEVVGRQRAHRRFTDRPVDDATIERLLRAATQAPSAENTQPWQFVVVRDDASRTQLADLARRAWEGGGRDYSRPRLSSAVFEDVEQANVGGGLATAPVWIVVAADTREVHASVVPSSIFPAVQNLLLAATAEGLGSALTTISLTFVDEVRDLLGLPEHVQAMAAVPLGHPARELGPPRREPVSEHAHADRFGQPWP